MVDNNPPPRLGGRGPAILGIAGLIGAVAVFLLVLLVLGVLPSPVNRPDTGLPAPIGTPGPSQLPQPARFATAGDCVLNVGTEARPSMVMVNCEPGALEVIERFEGTTKIEKCDELPGYRYHYYYDSELGDSLDFVLCMRERP